MTENIQTNKEDTIPLPALILGLAGLIPFAGCTLLLWLLEPDARSFAQTALLAYAAVILSFLGGVIWGTAIMGAGSVKWQPLLLAITPSLVGWAALLVGHVAGLSILTAGFIIQYFVDRHLAEAGAAPPWYIRLRRLLSIVVVICLLASLLKLALN